MSLVAAVASLSACGGGASSTGNGGNGGSAGNGSGGAARGGTGGAQGGRGGGGGASDAGVDSGGTAGGDAAAGTGGSGGSSGASGAAGSGTGGTAGSGGTVGAGGSGGARGGAGGGAGSGLGGGTGGGAAGTGGGAGTSTGGTGGIAGTGGGAGRGGGSGTGGTGGGAGTAGNVGAAGTGGAGGTSGSGGGTAGNTGAAGTGGSGGGTAGASGASGGAGAGGTGAAGTGGATGGTGGAAGTGGATGGSGGLSCAQCAAVVFACGSDAVCARCMDGESAACAGSAAYADALSCLCGQSARCARVDACLPAPPAPRLIGPVTANNQGPRPQLRWKTHPAADTSRILICRDRLCAVPVAELNDPTGAQPANNLAPGTYYWVGIGRRQLPGGAWIEGTVSSFTWQFVVGHGTASPLIGYGSLPDFDGDGRGDITITNTYDTDYYATGSLLDKSASVFRIHPNTSGPVRDQKFYTAGSTYFASQFRNVGDVNGDGYADAVTRTDSMTTGSPANVTLYNGGPNGLAAGASRQIGIVSYVLPALAWVGDVNGDGYADVGALTTDQSRYYLMLIRGGPNGLEAPDAPIDVGEWALYYDTIHGLGDVNGDGYADVEVNNFGQVKVFLGSATGFPSTPSYFFDGRYRGYPLGDVNDDGRADLLVEQVERVQSGIITTPQKAFLVMGGPNLAIDAAKVLNYPQYTPKTSDPCYQPKTYPCTYDMTGPFTAVGDLNGDGYGDVMLAGKVIQDPLRRVDIYFGSASGLGPSAGQELTNPDDTQPLSDYNFGWIISGLGDVNGDAFDDVAIGAYQGGSPLIPPRIAPKVRIYAGAASGPTATPTWTIISTQRTNLNDSFGTAICGIGG